MTTSLTRKEATPRHPWLDRFMADPQGEFSSLLRGYAEIPPYGRADAPDAAVQLFGPTPQDDPVRSALGMAIVEWLKERRAVRLPEADGARRRLIRETVEAFQIVARLKLVEAAGWCFDRRVRLNIWLSHFIDGSDRDARAEFLRMLALMQPLLAETRDVSPLTPLWQDICREAGSDLPSYYLSIGLLGLRQLPTQTGESDVAAWLAGLANWAVSQRPTADTFFREWRFLKCLYPRTPKVWRREISRLLGQNRYRDADVPLLEWWARDADLKPLQRQDAKHEAPLRSPMPDECTEIVEQLSAKGFDTMKSRIDTFVRLHGAFARTTGIADHLLAAFHQLGHALIELRDEQAVLLAEDLARDSLRWKPFDSHSWSLWANALEAADRVSAAELVRREHAGRLPFNVDAHAQLAEFLIATDRVEEARSVIDTAVEIGLANKRVTHAIAVRIAAHLEGVEAATAALDAALAVFPEDNVLVNYRRVLDRGDTLRVVANRYLEHPIVTQPSQDASDSMLVAFADFARLRRLSYDLEVPSRHDEAAQEVRRILEEEPEFAYAQLLSARHDLSWVGQNDSLLDVAAAFEVALHEEDRAKLEAIAARAPRLKALTLVARAVLGDEEAAKEVERWLEQDNQGTIMDSAGLRSWLAQSVRSSGKVFSFAEFATDRRGQILRSLRLSNEASVVDDLMIA